MDVGQLYHDLISEKQNEYRKGIYGYTQRTLAYNSNKIEGSTLSEEQTAALFDDGVLPSSTDYYRAKDIEEMNGHFLMFNKMLATIDQEISEDLIKAFHYELKSGVFEDRANGYAIGDYKKRPNMVGAERTILPKDVPGKMKELMDWYSGCDKTLELFAEFHMRYEMIHPFQDGNGRTGRLIIYRECLKYNIFPLIIEDSNRSQYISAIKAYRNTDSIDDMVALFMLEQEKYMEQCRYFYQE